MLTGDAAVLTGTSSDNGREIVRRFAAEGADVVVATPERAPRGSSRSTSRASRRS